MQPNRLLVPFAVLVGLAGLAPRAAAQGTPTIGAPQLLAGDLVPGSAGGEQQTPAIAAGPSQYLAAWEDHRAVFSSTLVGEGTREVVAQLIAADGTPLTPAPIPVAGGLGRKEDVRVAFNGTHYLVTWQNEVPTPTFKAAALFGARIDTAGNVLDDPPIVIRSYPWSSTFSYGLGSDGDKWAVVIQGTQAGEADVEGWLVHPNGIPQMVSPSLVTTTHLLYDYDLCWDGSQYLLTWFDSLTEGQRLTSGLAPIGPRIQVTPSGHGFASVTSDGSGFLVAYCGGFNGSQVFYREVTATGGLTAPTAVTPASAADHDYAPTVAWDGAGYTLVWTSNIFPPITMRTARIDASGTLVNFDGVQIPQGVRPVDPVVASTGIGTAQLAWVDEFGSPPNTGDVMGTRITPAGFDPEVAVGASAPRQGFPDLAAGPTGHLAVFTSERDGSVSILAQRVDADGASIDPQPRELAVADTYGGPRVAWNGTCYLVVWHDRVNVTFETDDVVLGLRLAPDGTPLDPAPFLIQQGVNPDVDAASGVFLVAAQFAWSTEIFLIEGVRVDGAGTVLDPTPLAIGSNFARFPRVASFGDRWCVTWQRNPTHDNPSASARARVVFDDGTLGTSLSLGAGGGPAVAASPSVALVAWSGGGNVQLARIAPGGSLIQGQYAATSAPEGQFDPSVAWNGAEFLVAWADQRNIAAFFDDRTDVYATRVSEAGPVLDPAGLPIATNNGMEQMPEVGGRDGTSLVAFADLRPEAPYGTVRIALSKVGDDPCGAQAYCQAAPNSVGPGAHLSHQGSTSVAANDLVLTVSDAVPGQFGLFFYGPNATQVPLGDGFLCVGSPFYRYAPQVIDPSGSALLPVDVTTPPAGAAGQIGAGSTWHFQFWYRDPAAGGAGSNLSDGLRATFCP